MFHSEQLDKKIEIKGIKIEKKDIKLYLQMILYIENPKEFTKKY